MKYKRLKKPRLKICWSDIRTDRRSVDGSTICPFIPSMTIETRFWGSRPIDRSIVCQWIHDSSCQSVNDFRDRVLKVLIYGLINDPLMDSRSIMSVNQSTLETEFWRPRPTDWSMIHRWIHDPSYQSVGHALEWFFSLNFWGWLQMQTTDHQHELWITLRSLGGNFRSHL